MDVSQLQVSIGADISAFQDAMNAMIEALDNVAQSIEDMANGYIDASAHIQESGSNIMDSLEKVGGSFLAVVGTLGILSAAFKGTTTIVESFEEALAANPIGLIASLIAALVVIVIECYERFDTFRGIVNTVWAVIKDLVVMIGDALIGEFKILYDIVTGLLQIFKDFGTIIMVFAVAPIKLVIDALQALYYAVVQVDWSKAYDSIKTFGSDAVSAANIIKDSALSIVTDTKTMAQNVTKDFNDSAQKIADTASGMSDDVSKAYKKAFETTKDVGNVKAKTDKLTLTPAKIVVDAKASNTEVDRGTSGSGSQSGIQSMPTPNVGTIPQLPSDNKGMDMQLVPVEGIKASKNAVMEYNESLAETAETQKLVQDTAASAFSSIGQALGEMAAGQKKVNPLAAIMKQMADALKKYGEFLITAGTAMLFGGDPFGAAKVGEGIALEAVGTAMGAIKMAQGGIVSGSTFANVGEYAGASHNPEVVAPLDKLRSMMGGTQLPNRIQMYSRFDELNATITRGSNNNGFVNGF